LLQRSTPRLRSGAPGTAGRQTLRRSSRPRKRAPSANDHDRKSGAERLPQDELARRKDREEVDGRPGGYDGRLDMPGFSRISLNPTDMSKRGAQGGVNRRELSVEAGRRVVEWADNAEGPAIRLFRARGVMQAMDGGAHGFNEGHRGACRARGQLAGGVDAPDGARSLAPLGSTSRG